MSDENEFDFGGQEGLADTAKMALTVYRAVKRDGATESEAFAITAAYIAGIMKVVYQDEGNGS